MSTSNNTKDESSDLQGTYSWTESIKGIYYGPGSLKTALPKLLKTIGGKKALIVTGKSLHTKTDIVRQVENVLKEHDAYGGTFWEIGQHVPITGIKKGVQAYKDTGADLIVSVGGGSPIDASKAIRQLLQKEFGGPFPCQIAIPTTLSAAEYTFGGGYSDEEGVRTKFVAPGLAPAGIILDAELTLATPEWLWLSTGMRAVDHAVEMSYRSQVPLPLKHLCYAALADLFKYLPQSKVDPQDVVARQKLQIASWMSLWPFMNYDVHPAIGLSHVLGHKLGVSYGIPHGITSCLTLSRVVALQAEVLSEDGKQWLAGALFVLRETSTGSKEGDILKLSRLINDLVVCLGLPSDLAQYNVPREDIPKIAEQALRGKENPLYPKVISLLESLYPN